MNIIQIGIMTMILITIGLIIFTMIQAYEPYQDSTEEKMGLDGISVKEKCIEKNIASTRICPPYP